MLIQINLVILMLGITGLLLRVMACVLLYNWVLPCSWAFFNLNLAGGDEVNANVSDLGLSWGIVCVAALLV